MSRIHWTDYSQTWIWVKSVVGVLANGGKGCTAEDVKPSEVHVSRVRDK